MGSKYSFVAAISFAAMLAIGVGKSSTATAASKPDSIRAFDAGPGWFIYDEPVDVALHVLNPAKPRCHEIGEVILLFETRDQLRDDKLIRQTALTGMNRYAELCQSLGAKPSRQQTIVGFLSGHAQTDGRGRIIGNSRLLEAMVSSLIGKYEVRIRHNAIAETKSIAMTSVTAASKNTPANGNAPAIGEHRKKYDAMLEASSAKAPAPGIVEGLTGGDRAKLTGVWSASPSDCVKERVILFEKNGVGLVEWWRAPNEKIGLLPWRTGKWELRDDTLIASFSRRVKYDRLRRKLRVGSVDETVQFNLKDVDGSGLRLAAIRGGFSPGRLFLGGEDKLFVRCNS